MVEMGWLGVVVGWGGGVGRWGHVLRQQFVQDIAEGWQRGGLSGPGGELHGCLADEHLRAGDGDAACRAGLP